MHIDKHLKGMTKVPDAYSQQRRSLHSATAIPVEAFSHRLGTSAEVESV
jgi:hypothetical protein